MYNERIALIADLAGEDEDTVIEVLELDLPFNDRQLLALEKYTDEELARFVADTVRDWLR